MTGGKESRVYGIEVKTGKIRYECTMAGCFSPTGKVLKKLHDNRGGVNKLTLHIQWLSEQMEYP